MRNYFEEMNIDYDELKSYEEIETYYDEVKDYSNLIQELQCDRVEALKQIVNKNKEIERLNNIISHIEEMCKSSIASVDKHLLDDKVPKVKDGKILNYNDYQIIRLKAFRTKSKEILGRIKELKGVDKE